MVRLYEKPDFYDEVAWKEVQLDVQQDKIIAVCAYMTQGYINRYFGSGIISDGMLEDMLHDTLVKVLDSIPDYQKREPAGRPPFWAYIYKQIEKWSKVSYHGWSSFFGETAETHRRAKKVWKMINEEQLSMEEVMNRTGYKKSTIEKYLMLVNCMLSLDKEMEPGNSLYDVIGLEQDFEWMADDEDEMEDKQFARYQPVLDTMNDEEQFIITTYLQMGGKKDFRRQTEILCKKRGISGRKVTSTIRVFKEKCKKL